MTTLWKALPLLLAAPAFAQDDTDTDTAADTDTDATYVPGQTAAERAGEQGGMDCGSGGAAAFVALLPIAALGRRRRTT